MFKGFAADLVDLYKFGSVRWGMTAEKFRRAMAGDKEFQSKRKALVFVSLLLLALVVSGAQIKEANTFIFKIEFSNHVGLRYLLVVAVMICMLRYYSYSERFNNQLFELWSRRLLDDYKIYSVDYECGQVSGLLGKRLNVHESDYDIESPVYRNTGFLKRSVGLKTSSQHDYYGQVYYIDLFDLNSYDEHWTRRDFERLLRAEFWYRLQAWVKYRETLDLVSPYLLASVSLLAFLFAWCKT